jgi:hypothetical protein
LILLFEKKAGTTNTYFSYFSYKQDFCKFIENIYLTVKIPILSSGDIYMIFVYPVILGILAGYIAGGRIGHIFQHTYHWKWAVVLAAITGIAAAADIEYKGMPNFVNSSIITLVSSILLIVFLLRNIKIPVISLIFTGAFLNMLYTLFKTIFKYSLPFIGHTIIIPFKFPFSTALSIGDIIIGIGLAVSLAANMKTPKIFGKPVYYISTVRRRK